MKINSKIAYSFLVVFILLSSLYSTLNAQSLHADSIKVMQGIHSPGASDVSQMEHYVRVEFAVANLDSIGSVLISLGTQNSPKEMYHNVYTVYYTGSDYLIKSTKFMTIVENNLLSIMILASEMKNNYYTANHLVVEIKDKNNSTLLPIVTKDIILKNNGR